MKNFDIVCLNNLDSNRKKEAAKLFVEGFKYIFCFTKDEQKLIDLFIPSFDYNLVHVCMANDEIVGIIALADNKKRVFQFEHNTCKNVFGNFMGNLLYKQLNSMVGKPVVKNNDELYIDYITTKSSMRGKGVATKLIEHVCSMPQYKTCYLEVLSKNKNAKKLYEQLGFQISEKKFDFFPIVLGFGQPYLMKKTI